MKRGYQLMSPTTDLEQRIINDLITGTDPDMDFYQDLTRAMMLVARSFDFMSEKLSHAPDSPDISKIINAAYWLITSVNFEIFYKNVKYHELGCIAVFSNQPIPSLDDFQFNSELAQGAYGSEEIEPLTYAAVLQFDDPAFLSKRRRQACQREIGQARYHLDSRALASLLGLEAHVVSILHDEQVLMALNSTRSDRDKIFDASELMRCVKERLTDSVPAGYLQVYPWSSSLKEHCNDYVRLLGWVLSGQLEGYLVTDSGFKVLYVEPLSFTILSRKHLAAVCNDPIPLATASGVLGIQEDDVKALIKQGKLLLARYSRNDWTLDGPKLYQYAISSRVQRGAATRRTHLTSPGFLCEGGES